MARNNKSKDDKFHKKKLEKISGAVYEDLVTDLLHTNMKIHGLSSPMFTLLYHIIFQGLK